MSNADAQARDPEPEDYEGHRAHMIAILDAQRRLVELLIHHLHHGDVGWSEDQRQLAETIALMVQGAGVSVDSIIKLAAEIGMNIRDCLGIARSVCETSLNVAYIAAGGPEARERAKRHAMQKSFRDINREASMGGSRIQVARRGDRPDPSQFPELEAALDEFTRKSGREVTEWTPHNLSERIDVVREKWPDPAMIYAVAVVSIYRHSSELLHGTYFGTFFFWTAGEDSAPRSRVEMEFRLVAHHLVTVFSATWLSLHALMVVLCGALGLDRLAAINARQFEESSRYVDGALQKIARPAAA